MDARGPPVQAWFSCAAKNSRTQRKACYMKRTTLLRALAVGVIALAAVVVVGFVAYRFGVTSSPNTPMMRGMPVRGYFDARGGELGIGLFGLVSLIAIGLLFLWLVGALLSPYRGGPSSTGSAAGDMERLRELSEMHDGGKLTDDEFTAAKRKLLGLQ
jgi:Short C-terminal domain